MAWLRKGARMYEDFAMSNWVDGGAIRKMRKMRIHHWVDVGRRIKISVEV